MEKTIYDLKLHETLELDDDITIIRVPGGWIYTYYSDYYNQHKTSSMVFVPYSLEFNEDLKIPPFNKE